VNVNTYLYKGKNGKEGTRSSRVISIVQQPDRGRRRVCGMVTKKTAKEQEATYAAWKITIVRKTILLQAPATGDIKETCGHPFGEFQNKRGRPRSSRKKKSLSHQQKGIDGIFGKRHGRGAESREKRKSPSKWVRKDRKDAREAPDVHLLRNYL